MSKPKNVPGYVYVIMWPDGFYKIGYSKHPFTRLKEFQRYSPHRLYIVCIKHFNNPYKIEQYLHNRYGTLKIRRGEFYKLTDEQARDILRTIDSLEEGQKNND